MTDYYKILLAYIDMVGEAEGVDFVSASDALTNEENAALFRAAAEGQCSEEHRQYLLRRADELEAVTK